MSEPPIQPLPPERTPPPVPPLGQPSGPLVPEYERPVRQSRTGAALAFFTCFFLFFPVTLGLFFVIPGDRAVWISPVLALVVVGGSAGWRRSSMGFLGVLVAFVLGLLSCGVCAGLLNHLST